MSKLLFVCSLCAALLACGGGPKAVPDEDERPTEPAPLAGRPTTQYYLVLTPDPKAMQTKIALDALWRAVDGDTIRYRPIRNQVVGVPPNYRLDLLLDFAELPHPSLDPAKLAALLADQPIEVRAKARAAKLGVLLRIDAPGLPGAGHLRLGGTAALFVADRFGGVVVDLMARRAWTPDAWQAELAAPELSPRQVRVTTRDGGKTLLSRGAAKFGAPDLLMEGVEPGAVAARARFQAGFLRLLNGGGRVGDRLDLGEEDLLTLEPCELPEGTLDAACVRLDAP